MLTNDALDTAYAVREADDEDAAKAIIGDYLDGLGIHMFGSVIIEQLGNVDRAQEVAWATNASATYFEVYQQSGFAEADWGLRTHAERRRVRPYFMGHSFADSLEGLRDDERRHYAEAADWGYRSAIALPTWSRTPYGVRPSGHALWSSLGAADFEALMREHGSEIALVMSAAEHAFLPVLQHAVFGYEPLTGREAECLALVANGLRPAAIADRLCLATVTVTVHISRAKRKLRASTLPQAVARAIAVGAIRP